MNHLSIPNLMSLFVKDVKFSFLGFVLTYVVLPVTIYMLLLGSGLVMPVGMSAMVFFFYKICLLALLHACLVSVFMKKQSSRTKAIAYMGLSFATPYAIWGIFVLSLRL